VNARLCTSLLRYCKDIRADKAFLDAGDANRKINQNDMAFIFFNRYIDLWDAIQDPDGNMIQENTDFEGTDIPVPYEIPLPEKNLLSESERDQIRDWVLQINMDGGVGNALPTRCCEFCNYDGLYEAALNCPQCKSTWDPCIITGYPLVRSNAISCKFCNMGALRDAWNDFIGVTMHCPWCNQM
jgi:intraflagellar transport protein 172